MESVWDDDGQGQVVFEKERAEDFHDSQNQLGLKDVADAMPTPRVDLLAGVVHEEHPVDGPSGVLVTTENAVEPSV